MEPHEEQYGFKDTMKWSYMGLYMQYKSLKGYKPSNDFQFNLDPEYRMDMFFMHDSLFPENSEGSAFVELREKPAQVPKTLTTQMMEEDVGFDDYLRRNSPEQRVEDYLNGKYGGADEK